MHTQFYTFGYSSNGEEASENRYFVEAEFTNLLNERIDLKQYGNAIGSMILRSDSRPKKHDQKVEYNPVIGQLDVILPIESSFLKKASNPLIFERLKSALLSVLSNYDGIPRVINLGALIRDIASLEYADIRRMFGSSSDKKDAPE